MKSIVKTMGKIYTPNYLVKNICDMAGYVTGKINKKHVIDNSCGDGAFLCEIIERYINDFLIYSNDKKTLKKELEEYVHGIELDYSESELCKKNMQNVCLKYGIESVKFDIVCANTLHVLPNYLGKMDFILGNPPYVRVHNFGNNYQEFKDFEFSQGGMTDLYLVFYEIGIKMLNKTGILSYIAPSSFFTSLAGKNFRKRILKTNKIVSICDLKHFQPFNAATTYTAIVTISNSKSDDTLEYFEYDTKKLIPKKVCNLTKNEYSICDNFYFSTKIMLKKLKKILEFVPFGSSISVKNGFATLADKIFIGYFDFDSKYIIKVLKVSIGKWYQCIFPYDKRGKLINIKDLEADHNLYEYMLSQKENLTSRKIKSKSDWYGFGRTQAIADVKYDRISVNSLYRGILDVRVTKLSAGTGCYSGLYIISDFTFEEIQKALKSNEFIDYISMLGKYKSGGYYTCSSKDIKQYLDYYFYSSKKIF